MDSKLLWRSALCAVMAIAGLSLCASAGIPEKYGQIQQDNKGQIFHRVKFLMKRTRNNNYNTNPEITYVDYYPDGKVIWDWYQFDDRYREVTGQRSDDAGSFKVRAGDVIGWEYWSGTASYESGKICIYPMMQLDGHNILVIDRDYIYFNVTPDETVSMQWDNVPAQAIPGFGPVDKEYREGRKDNYSKSYYYPYGPSWQMYTDFSMTPLLPDQNSVEDIGEESADKGNQFYDLFGRKVNGQPQTPGIYICNGRKILIK